MTKIKIVGMLIFLLSIALAILFIYTNNQNKINNNLLNTINEQKAFTQEISKNIFYIYRNSNSSTAQLNDSIKKFIDNMNHKEEIFKSIDSILIKNKNDEIALLWNKFYLSVQNFRDKNKTLTVYSNILLEDIVKDIYNTNLKLVVEFDELIHMHQKYFDNKLQSYKYIQYALFVILLVLLIYLFTQLNSVITFMQKFLNTSTKIIKNSTIKELKPIKLRQESKDISTASNNFNFLVNKINTSIENSALSIENTHQSLDDIEKNIEDLLTLIYEMDESKEIDKEFTKREDAIIQSLEELTSSSHKLKNLKVDLDNLISTIK